MIIPYSKDLQYFVSIDSEMVYNCFEFGCDEEGICRCGQYIQTNVCFINYEDFSQEFFPDKPDELQSYLLTLFLKKTVDFDMFDIEVHSGYYGEEIDKVCFSPSSNFEEQFYLFKSLSDKEKIEYILKLEYGYVLPEISEIKKWQIQLILLSDLDVNKNVLSDIQIKPKEKEIAQNYAGSYSLLRKHIPICGIALKKDNERFRLIDGHHRYSAWTGLIEPKYGNPLPNRKKIKLLIGE